MVDWFVGQWGGSAGRSADEASTTAVTQLLTQFNGDSQRARMTSPSLSTTRADGDHLVALGGGGHPHPLDRQRNPVRGAMASLRLSYAKGGQAAEPVRRYGPAGSLPA